jgi:hypothetical protein
MNTEIYYMYRDGGNYKQHETVVVAGIVTKEQLLEHCDEGQYFLPTQVGLCALQERMCSDLCDLDHAWHELCEVERTTKEPTIRVTAEELLERFKEPWNLEAEMEAVGLTEVDE